MAKTAYERVRLARANGRPTAADYISHVFQVHIQCRSINSRINSLNLPFAWVLKL